MTFKVIIISIFIFLSGFTLGTLIGNNSNTGEEDNYCKEQSIEMISGWMTRSKANRDMWMQCQRDLAKIQNFLNSHIMCINNTQGK